MPRAGKEAATGGGRVRALLVSLLGAAVSLGVVLVAARHPYVARRLLIPGLIILATAYVSGGEERRSNPELWVMLFFLPAVIFAGSTRGCSVCSSGFCPAPNAALARRCTWHPLQM